MKKIKAPHFIFTVIAVILGSSSYKQFDFETHEIENPALFVVYMIGFILSVYAIISDYRKQVKKKDADR